MTQVINFELQDDNSIKISLNDDSKIIITVNNKQISSEQIFNSLEYQINNKYEIKETPIKISELDNEKKNAHIIMQELKNLYEKIISQINNLDYELNSTYDEIHSNSLDENDLLLDNNI